MENEVIYQQNKWKSYLIFAISCIITFCILYVNKGKSILYVAIVLDLFLYAWFYFNNRKIKSETWFYLITIFLSGISTILTMNQILIQMSIVVILILFVSVVIYELFDEEKWETKEYFIQLTAILLEIIKEFHTPISDQMKNKSEKKIRAVEVSTILFFTTLFIISIGLNRPELYSTELESLKTLLLGKQLINTILCISGIYFFLYLFMNRSQKIENEKEYKEEKGYSSYTTTFLLGILSCIYLIFNIFQIYLMIREKWDIPYGYTYSDFIIKDSTLLFVLCILNFLLLAFCHDHYAKSWIKKSAMLLIVVSTYIKLFTSSIMIINYVSSYHLTTKRFVFIWMILMLIFINTGMLIQVWKEEFYLFRYTVVVAVFFFIILSYCKPDFLIAKYNINIMVEEAKKSNDRTYYYQDFDYVYTLSPDIIPALRDFVEEKQIEYFLPDEQDTIKESLYTYIDTWDTEIENKFSLAKYQAELDVLYLKELQNW